jgi:hypothetical protein
MANIDPKLIDISINVISNAKTKADVIAIVLSFPSSSMGMQITK